MHNLSAVKQERIHLLLQRAETGDITPEEREELAAFEEEVDDLVLKNARQIEHRQAPLVIDLGKSTIARLTSGKPAKVKDRPAKKAGERPTRPMAGKKVRLRVSKQGKTPVKG